MDEQDIYCICGTTMKLSSFSENFDVSKCTSCRSQSFISVKDNPVVEFNYNGDNEKYTHADYLHGEQLRWAHRKLLEKDWRKKKILEIGCFNGFFLNKLRIMGADVYGHDLNQQAVKIGREAFSLHDRIYISFEEVTKKGPFDAIILIDVLEHVDDPVSLVSELRSHLSKEGELIIAGPIADRIFYDKSDFPPHHKWRFSIKGLKCLFNRFSMDIEKVYIQRDALLLIRNFLGRLIIGFSKREYCGDNLITPIGRPSGVSGLLYSGFEMAGTLIFNILRIKYCSAIIMASNKHGAKSS